MDAQHFSFYITLSNYVWSILFNQNKYHNVRQIRFHVCIKMHRCKRWVCKRKTLFGQANSLITVGCYRIVEYIILRIFLVTEKSDLQRWKGLLSKLKSIRIGKLFFTGNLY